MSGSKFILSVPVISDVALRKEVAKWKSEHPEQPNNAFTSYVISEEGHIKKFILSPIQTLDQRSRSLSPIGFLNVKEFPLHIVDLTYIGAATKEIILRINPQFDEERRKAREQIRDEKSDS